MYCSACLVGKHGDEYKFQNKKKYPQEICLIGFLIPNTNTRLFVSYNPQKYVNRNE